LTSESETPATEAPPSTKRAHLSDRRFADFPLSPEILKGILEYGFEYATPVQAAAIEPALAGKDLLVRAQTGSGKTGAFGIPLVEAIDTSLPKTQAIVLLPTRELANQVARELDALGQYRGVRTLPIYGGVAYGPQLEGLDKGAHIIVGTPGRILDHLKSGRMDLGATKVLVLDEADEMLGLGFWPDMKELASYLPKKRQSHLFSATMPERVRSLSRFFLNNAEDVTIDRDNAAPQQIEHYYYVCTASEKESVLARILAYEEPESAIIFCNTKADVRFITAYLAKRDFNVDQISGDLPQSAREKAMNKIKAGNLRFLVATDVAARGIDISDLAYVINYTTSDSPEVYVHRTGRTGRAGKSGIAISLVSGLDIGTRTTLEKVKKVKFEVRALPNPEDAVARRVARQATRIREVMGTMAFEAYLPTVQALKNQEGGDALLAAALRAFFQWDRTRRAATSSVDSLGALEESRREERREKSDRGPRRRDGDRREGREDRREGRETRGRSDDRRDSRGRDDRRDDRPRAPKKPVSTSDLDDLLVSDDTPAAASTDADDTLLVADDTTEAAAPGDAAKKKRRRRRRKGGKGAGAEGSDASETDVDDVLEVSEAPAGADDLDALLSAE
jgi:ATP-dependent RNA helicase DeaD